MPKHERPCLVVHRPGLFTTVQDLGRCGYQRYGLSVSGAMDRIALRIGNRLVGNPDGFAGLEVTLQGPELEFTADAMIAITGADLSPTVNEVAVPMWTTISIRSGERLGFGLRRQGSRSYVCVKGGLDVPIVFGSRSTDVRAGIGGIDGRRLVKGDYVRCGHAPSTSPASSPRAFPIASRPMYRAAARLRVILGPQSESFSRTALELLRTSHYVVSKDSDRMGCRLQGAPIPYPRPIEFVSDAAATGAIQVPADQRPILLMADCQTTGGYPKIASVITVDLSQGGQLAPGDQVSFAVITAQEATLLCRMERKKLDRFLPPILFPSP